MDRLSYICLPNFYSFRQLIQDVQETDGQPSKSKIRMSFMVCGEQLLAAELKEINMLLTAYSIFSIIYLKEVIIPYKRLTYLSILLVQLCLREDLQVFSVTPSLDLSETQEATIMVFSVSEEKFYEMQVFLRTLMSWECCILLFNLTSMFNLENTIIFPFIAGWVNKLNRTLTQLRVLSLFTSTCLCSCGIVFLFLGSLSVWFLAVG